MDVASPTVPTTSHRQGWYVVIICMVAYVLSFIDRQILSLLIEPIKADLGLSDTQFGLLGGLAFSLFYATMGIPIASLADRRSRPWIIATGIAVWSIATAMCGLARSFPQLFIARIGVGAGEASLSPASYSLIGDIFPRDTLGRALAVYSLGSFLGAGIAFLVGGAVIGMVSAHGVTVLGGVAFKPWQLVFLIVGLPGIFLSSLILLTVHEPREARGAPAADIPAFGAVLAMLWERRAIFLPHMAGFTMAAMTLFALLSWAPAYLMRTYHLTPASSGVWLGVIAIVAGGGGVLTSGWSVDRMTRRGRGDAAFRTGMIGTVGTVAPLALLPFSATLWVSAGLLSVALFFASFPMPPSTAVMQVAVPPRMRSRVAAIFLCCNSFIGLSLGSALVGILNDRVFPSPAGVGASMALVAASAAVIATGLLAMGCRPLRAFRE